jgi:AcrR family transcriptional regulator
MPRLTTSSAVPSPPIAAEEQDRRRRPHRREQIIRAAVGLFYERGFQATSMEDIGAAVDMSGPSLYRHFGSKLEILEACVRVTWTEYDHAIAELRERKLAPRPHLEEFVRIYTDALLADPVATAVWVRERGCLSEETRREADRVDRLVAGEWRSALIRVRPDLDATSARLIVRGALQLCFAMCTLRTRLSRDRVAAAIERSMLAALLA